MKHLQQGGTIRDYIKSNRADGTSVARPNMLTAQEASDNQAASQRKQYIERMNLKANADKLKLKGQTELGNTINDMGTNMLTLTTKFRAPNNDEINQGRGSWKERGKLIADATTQHMTNELTGGAMNYISGKIATGGVKSILSDGKAAVKQATNAAKSFNPNTTPVLKDAYKLNPWKFKPNPDSYYRRIGDQRGLDDLVESRVIRGDQAPPDVMMGRFNMTKSFGDNAYFAKGVPLDGRYNPSNYSGPNMVEVPGEAGFKAMANGRLTARTNPVTGLKERGPHVPWMTGQYSVPNSAINIDQTPGVKAYTEDWLRGYKQVPLAKPEQVNLAASKYRPPRVQKFMEHPVVLRIRNAMDELDPSVNKTPALKWMKDWVEHPINKQKALDRQLAERPNSAVMKPRPVPFKNLDKTTVKDMDQVLEDYTPEQIKGREDALGFSGFKQLTDPEDNGLIHVKTRGRTNHEQRSTAIHEYAHSHNAHAHSFFMTESDELQAPFKGYKPTSKKDAKDYNYYGGETEIYSRMSQLRHRLNLNPGDEFTPKHYDKLYNYNRLFGMGKYITNKDKFVKLMNNFYTPAGIAAGVSIKNEKANSQ